MFWGSYEVKSKLEKLKREPAWQLRIELAHLDWMLY